MKYLMLFILCLSASSVFADNPVSHLHDGRAHSHALPSEGVGHKHTGLGPGVLKAASTTTGDKSPIINQPQTVIFNNFSEDGTKSNETSAPSGVEAEAEIEKRIGDVVVGIKKCTQQNETITCDFTVTSKNENETISVTINSNSKLIDHRGNEYDNQNSIQFGDKNKAFPEKELIGGIGVHGRINFNQIKSKGSVIPLLKFGFSSRDKNKIYTVFNKHMDFKNIRLGKN